MSFKFQGNKISYDDINKYFDDMRISRENNKKRQEEIKRMEEDKYKETLEIIKNHSEFLTELNNKKLYKYGGNSSITPIFKFDISKIENKNIDNYELVFKDDGGVDEVANLLTMVINNKKKKIKENDYINKKLNLFMIITGISITYLLLRK
jgi:hypothetical protein